MQKRERLGLGISAEDQEKALELTSNGHSDTERGLEWVDGRIASQTRRREIGGSRQMIRRRVGGSHIAGNRVLTGAEKWQPGGGLRARKEKKAREAVLPSAQDAGWVG